MTNILVKLFVKKYDYTNDEKVRSQYGVLTSIVGVICNLILFIIKCAVGIWIQSISVTADAFNNLSDASSSIISFIGVKMANKPADEHHPFGHGRIEYITAFIIACIILQVGFSLFKTSFSKILNPEQMVFHLTSVLVLIISIVLKLWLGIFNRTLGKKTQSKVMLATSADSLGDAVTTSAIIVSLLINGIWGINIDGFTGILVSIIVMFAGIKVAKDTLAPLIGEASDPGVCQKITSFVEGYQGILGTHDLIVHNYGPSKSMASIHAEVPNDVEIEISHEIIDKIERECFKQHNIFLVIHMDPIETKDTRVHELKKFLEEVIEGIDNRINYHDFRIVPGVERINLIFDLVIPRDYNKEKSDQLKNDIQNKFNDKNNNLYCIITLENSFCVQNEKISG